MSDFTGFSGAPRFGKDIGSWSRHGSETGPASFQPVEDQPTYAAVAAVGSETTVNTTAGAQTDPRITYLADGRYVVVWTSNPGSNFDAIGRIFNADGTAFTAEFTINTTTAGSQFSPDVTALAGGGFAVTWTATSSGQDDIRVRVFSATGAALTGEIVVNDPALSYNANFTQFQPVITGLSGGGFAVAWTDASGVDSSGFGVRTRVFSADGTALAAESGVNTTTVSNQQFSAIARAGSGYIVVWQDASGAAGQGTDIRAQRFDANGAKVGGEILVTSAAGVQAFPAVIELLNGNLVIAWHDANVSGDGSGFSVKARIMSPTGTLLGTELLLNATTNGDQADVALARLVDGGFVATFTDYGLNPGDTSGYAVRSRTFDANGAPTSAERLVNTLTAQDQGYSAVAANGLGNYVVAFGSTTSDSGDIIVSRFAVSQTVTVTNTSNVGDTAALELDGAFALTTATAGGNSFVIAGGNEDAGVTVLQLVNGVLTPVFSLGDTADNHLGTPRSAHAAIVDGVTYVYIGGDSTGFSAFRLNANGSLDLVQDIVDTAANTVRSSLFGITSVVVGATTYLYVSSTSDSGITGYSIGAGGALTQVGTILDSGNAAHRFGTVAQISPVTVGGNQYLLAASTLESAVNVLRINGDGTLGFVSAIADDATLRLSNTSTLTTAVAGGVTYVYAGGFGDSGISVFSLSAAGVLTNVQNVADDASTGLVGAVTLNAFTADGRQYLAVGGQENGVTLFLIGSDGRLIFDQMITDTASTYMLGRAHVTSVSAAGATYLLTTGLNDDGVSAFLVGAGPTNTAPTLTGLATSFTVAENAPATLLDSDVTLTDDGNLANGRVTVSGLLAEDRVSIRFEGTGAGQIAFAGGIVYYGNTPFGTVTGGVGSTLTVILNNAATTAAVDALIQNLTYQNVSDAPTASRTLRINVIDAAGAGIGNPATFVQLSGGADPFAGLDVGVLSKPTFLDFDNDGDLDLISGHQNGNIYVFRNNGVGNAFTAVAAGDNPFASFNVGGDSTPAAADLDGDGDLDLLVGENDGFFNAYRNNGNGTFTSISITGLTGVFFSTDTAPAFVDFDGDGDLDVVSGNSGGTLMSFRNNGNGNYTRLTGTDNPFNGINVGTISAPSFLDFDADGDLDALIGNVNGTIVAYRNNGGSSFTQVTGTANPFNSLNAGLDSALAFADLDNDGDLDAVTGARDGFFLAFRNDATNGVPITVNVTAQNDAPTIANLQGDAITATENTNTQPYYDLGQNAVITDVDSANFNGGSLTVAVTGGLVASADRIVIIQTPTVTLTSTDGFINSNVLVNGVVIGTVQNNFETNNLVINFTSDAATAAAVQAVLRQIAYVNTSDNPGAGTRTITTTLVDGDGGTDRSSYTTTVNVIATNDAPVLSAGAGTASFVESGTGPSTPVAVAPGLGLSDVDNTTLASATATISANRQASDVLAFVNTSSTTFGNIAASYVSGTGTLTLTSAGATATLAQFQAALRAVTFTNTSDTPSTATRTVSFVVNDGAANSVATTRNVAVTATNDAPLASADSYILDEDTTLIVNAANGVLANDSDPEGSSLTAVLVSGPANASSFTLNADGSFTYVPTANFAGTDSFSYRANDGTSDGNIVTVTLNVTDLPDGPVLDLNGVAPGTGSIVSAPDGQTVRVAPDAIVSDPSNAGFNGATLTVAPGAGTTLNDFAFVRDDGGTFAPGRIGVSLDNVFFGPNNQIATISGNGPGGTLVVTFNANATAEAVQAVVRVLSVGNVSETESGSRSFAVTLNDGTGAATTSQVTFLITPENDAPYASVNGGPVAFVEDAGAVAIAPAFTVTDGDSATLLRINIGITSGFAAGQDVLSFVNNDSSAFGNITASYDAANGVLTLQSQGSSATVAQFQNAARAVTYLNSSQAPSTQQRVFSFLVNDGSGGPEAFTTQTLTVTAVNDAPTSTGFDNIIYTEGQAATTLDTGFNQILTDPDSANFDGGSLVVSITAGRAAGEDFLTLLIGGQSFLSVSGNVISYNDVAFATFSPSGAGLDRTFTFNANATLQAVQTLMRNVAYYNSNQGNPSTEQRTVSYTLTDGDGGTLNLTSTINVVATNDAPALTAPTNASIVFTEGGSPTPLMQGVVLSDADAPANLAGGSISLTVGGTGGGINLRAGSAYSIAANGDGTFSLNLDVGGTSIGIGTIAGFGTTNVQITALTAQATLARLNDLIDDFSYINLSDTPDTSARTVTLTVNDGTASGSTTQTLTVAATNDAPVAVDDLLNFTDTVELLSNGGFENGLTGWTVSNLGDGNWSVENDTRDPNNQLNSGPQSGSFFVLTYQLGPGAHALQQGFTVPATATSVTLSYARFIQTDAPVAINAAGLNPGVAPNQHGRIDLLVSGATAFSTAPADVIRNFFIGADGPVPQPWSLSSFDITANVVAGGTYALRFAEADNQGFFGFGVDSVSVRATVASTPTEDVGVTIATSRLLANDSDPDGDTLVVSAVSATSALGATVTLNGDGTITYAPAGALDRLTAGEVVQDSFTYTISDPSGATSTATVRFSVTGMNDAPVLDLDSVSAGTGSALSYVENGSAALVAPAALVSDADSANFDGGTLTVAFAANGNANDRLAVVNTSTVRANNGQIEVGVMTTMPGPGGMPAPFFMTQGVVGTYTGGIGTTPLVITFNSNATPARVQQVLQAIGFSNLSDDPSTAARSLGFTLTDGDGGTTVATAAVSIVASDDAPAITFPAAQSGTEDVALVFSTATNNAVSVADPDTQTLVVTIRAEYGTLTLASTTGLSAINGANGSTYFQFSGTAAAINAALNGLTYRGDLNYSGADALVIETSDGNSTRTAEVAINLAPDNVIDGDGTNNNIDGTPQDDFFDLSQGGDDNVRGYESNDGFYFGAAYNHLDVVNGGTGSDQIGLQGNYGSVTRLGSLIGVELVVLLPGDDIRFGGQTGTNLTYRLAADAGTLVSNNSLSIQANMLRIGETFEFNGSASSIDFLIYAGFGTDILTGGAGDDGFFFGGGRFGVNDVVHGGLGSEDQLGLQGNFVDDDGDNSGTDTGGTGRIVFGEAQLSGIEAIVLLSASDTRFALVGGQVGYDLTMANGNVAAGQTMIINGNTLSETEALTFIGSAELDGRFEIYSGASDDYLVGSQGNDIIFGGAGADFIRGEGGADELTGGDGDDLFIYTLDDTSTAATPAADRILDFTRGDTIDLFAIGGVSFIGSADRTGARQLQVIQTGDQAVVSLYLNGDSQADLVINVTVADGHILTADDFSGISGLPEAEALAPALVEDGPHGLMPLDPAPPVDMIDLHTTDAWTMVTMTNDLV